MCSRAETDGPTIRPVGGAVAVTQLLAQCFDADRYGADAPAALLELVRSASTLDLTYHDAAEAANVVEALSATTTAPRQIRPLPGPSLESSPRRSDTTRSWVIDGDVVISAEGGEKVLALSGSGASLWEQLDGTVTVESIIESISATSRADPLEIQDDVFQMLADLQKHGLISQNQRYQDTTEGHPSEDAQS